MTLLTIGDSIPYGQADCGFCASFPTLFGEWIETTTGKTVDTVNVSRHDGLTAARLAVELPGMRTAMAAIPTADVIVVTIGHNDTPWNATDDACDADHGPVDGFPGASWTVYAGACVQTEVE